MPAALAQNQERGFRSQRGGCLKWTLLYVAPLIALWFFLHIVSAILRASLPEHPTAMEVDSAVAAYSTLAFVGYIAAFCTVAVIAGRRRSILRQQHSIAGSEVSDAALHLCCGCCALAQEARQIAHQERVHMTAETDAAGTPHMQAQVTTASGSAAANDASAAPLVALRADDDSHISPTTAVPLAQPVYESPKEEV